MSNKFIIATSFLFATIATEISCSSPWSEVPWEYSCPPAPKTSPQASPYRNSESTTTTVPHDVSPLDCSTLEESMVAQAPNSTIKQISKNRYHVRKATTAEQSPNWREESIFDANGNAEQTLLVPSKNEIAFQKTFLAAALRASKSEQSNKTSTPTHSSKTIKQTREEEENQEIVQLRKDSRSPLGDREFWS